MVLIVSRDIELAQRLGKCVVDEKDYLVKGAKDQTEFRHEVYTRQADVVLLDATFGGNAYRVLESVPKIASRRSAPMVVLLTPWHSKDVEKEAAVAGCYDVINVDGPALKRRVAKVVAAAFVARSAGEASSLPFPKATH